LSTTSELERLLQSKREVGQVEFDAEFTINSLKARKKLSESQLPGAGLWLVKLVQAAVVQESQEIRISFQKRLVEFHSRGGTWDWDPRHVVSTLLSGELPKDPFLFHFLAGLRGSILEDTLETHWVIADQTSEFHIRFSESGAEISEEPRKEQGEVWFRLRTTRPPRWPGLKRATYMPLKHLIRRTADEFMAVHNYCWTCPVPLKVDGRFLECRYRTSPKPGETSAIKLSTQYAVSSPTQAKPSGLVRRSVPALPGRPELELEWAEAVGTFETFSHGPVEVRQKKHVYFEDTWMTIPGAEGVRPGGYLVVLFAHQMESQVEFYCDGARVDCHPLPWGSENMKVFGKEIPQNAFKVGIRVLLPVTIEELDLSHFRVRDIKGLVDSYSPTLKLLIKDSAEICLARGDEFSFRFAPRPDSSAGKLGSGLMAAVMKAHIPVQIMKKQGFKGELKSLLASLED
jgi:hypothetical protein